MDMDCCYETTEFVVGRSVCSEHREDKDVHGATENVDAQMGEF